MFTLEQPMNPLEYLLSGAANTLVKDEVQKQAKRRDQQNIMQGLSQFNEKTSPLEAISIIEGIDTSEENKKRLHEFSHKAFGNKLEEEKLRGTKEKENQEKQGLAAEAKALGIDPEEYAKYSPQYRKSLQTASMKKEPKPRVSEIPIDPDQMRRIQEARNSEGFDDLDEVGQYRRLTEYGVSSINAKNEAELKSKQVGRQAEKIDKSFAQHKDFIDKTTNSYQAFESETKPRLMQMQSIPPEELVSPTAAAFLDYLGIPLGALENPGSEVYEKLSQDLLKGLPDTYGNRILKVEVDNFLKTIPRIVNSVEGRRMIASNILKLGEMKKLFYDEMRRQQKEALDTDKPLPKDFQQRVLDNVMPQLSRFNSEFSQMSQLTSIPPNTVPFFNPQGNISFIPNTPEDIQWAQSNGGKRIW